MGNENSSGSCESTISEKGNHHQAGGSVRVSRETSFNASVSGGSYLGEKYGSGNLGVERSFSDRHGTVTVGGNVGSHSFSGHTDYNSSSGSRIGGQVSHSYTRGTSVGVSFGMNR